jgi:PHD/YefM family antitoxin component YafN of YafNO toxin-antitoxin module
MNILAANDIKKYGVGILEKKLAHGPVHVLKHNHPLFVVISEEEYSSLLAKKQEPSGLFAMLNKPATGSRSRQDIDEQLKEERDKWE